MRWGQDWCARARVRATSEHRDPKAGRKTSPSRHTRGRLWSNSLVRAFLADLTALPTNLPVPPREATRKNALIAPVHRDKHTLERQGRPRRPSRDFIPSAPSGQRIYARIYVPSRAFPPARLHAFSLAVKSGEREPDRDRGEREARQMSISTMHRWEGGNESVINRRSQEISSLFLFLLRSICIFRLSFSPSFLPFSLSLFFSRYICVENWIARFERDRKEPAACRFWSLVFQSFNKFGC